MWSWLKRHPKFLPVFGTLIVLTTFSIKEGWRDSVRDQLQELSNQHSTLVLALRFDSTTFDMYTLQSEIMTAIGPVTRDRMAAAVDAIVRTRFLYESQIDRLEAYSKTFGNQCAQCVKDCRGEARQMETNSFALLEATELEHPTISQRTKDIYGNAGRQTVKLRKAVEALMVCVGKQHVARRSELNSLQYELTTASTALYLVGGLIGIAGILVDSKGKV